MEVGKTIHFSERQVWRKWLEENHGRVNEIWVVIYKKHTGKQTITYDEAVEEALCFGWIDGIMKKLDDEKFAQRFSPRNPQSVWSLINKKRALKLIKEKKMTEAGLKTIGAARKTGKWQAAYSSKTKPDLPPDLKKALRINTQALINFNKFSNSQQLAYIYWVLAARKIETRNKRVGEVVVRSSKNIKNLV